MLLLCGITETFLLARRISCYERVFAAAIGRSGALCRWVGGDRTVGSNRPSTRAHDRFHVFADVELARASATKEWLGSVPAFGCPADLAVGVAGTREDEE
jgi:hypothetical protein